MASIQPKEVVKAATAAHAAAAVRAIPKEYGTISKPKQSLICIFGIAAGQFTGRSSTSNKLVATRVVKRSWGGVVGERGCRDER